MAGAKQSARLRQGETRAVGSRLSWRNDYCPGCPRTSYIAPISEVGVGQLRKSGMNVDLQSMHVATMTSRRTNKEKPGKGGWNVSFAILDGLFNANPATNVALRGDRKSGMPGWPDSPRLEALREDWLAAGNVNAYKRISEQMRDCRKFWGVSVKGLFPRLFFDREWTRGLGFEVGENRR
jgi:hypothetical protein